MTDEQTTPASDELSISKLGAQLDGWADLVEGMGGKTKEVREAILQELISKKIPKSQVKELKGFISSINRKYRIYLTVTKSPGIKSTVYVGQHGTDLFISWRTYISTVINWQFIMLLFFASIISGVLFYSQAGGRLISPNQIFFITSIATFIILVAILGKLGELLHHNPGYFFVERVTVMTADDIAALSLAVHKAIFRAFDQVGIDTSKLRLKEKFSGGRKGEDI